MVAQLCVRDGILTGGAQPLDDGFDHGLEARPREGLGQVLGHAIHGGDVGQADLCLGGGGEFDFRPLGGFLEALHGLGLLAQIDAFGLLEFLHQPIHDQLVHVVATQVGIAVGGLYFHHALAHFENGNIKGAAAEIEDRDGAILFLVHSVGQGCGGGLVDDAHDFQTRDGTGVLGGLALGVIEVGRHRDNGLGDLLAQVSLGTFLHFAENDGTDFLRAKVLPKDAHGATAFVGALHVVRHEFLFFVGVRIGQAHESLDGIDRVFGLGHGLALGRGAHQSLGGLGVVTHGAGRGLGAFRVGNDFGRTALHHGDATIGGA